MRTNTKTASRRPTVNAQNHDNHDTAHDSSSDDDFMIFNIHPRRDVPAHGEHDADHGQAETAHD
jgi:hypothetical protein